jgi:hypothetical protein
VLFARLKGRLGGAKRESVPVPVLMRDVSFDSMKAEGDCGSKNSGDNAPVGSNLTLSENPTDQVLVFFVTLLSLSSRFRPLSGLFRRHCALLPPCLRVDQGS